MIKRKGFSFIYYISALMLCGLYPYGSKAQTKSHKEKMETRQNVVSEVGSASNLIKEYRFDEAIKVYQKNLNNAKRNHAAIGAIEEEIQKARLGADMLRGTERVIVVDSMVVSREQFLAAYQLSKGSGYLGKLADFIPALSSNSKGACAFMNDFKDYAVFAMPDSSGLKKLCASTRLGSQWSKPQRLRGMGQSDDIQDYPFLMADGLTLYFAAQGSESLGGYDIFVTRRNSSTSDFLRAENVGMPFNSPFNDYLMVIDENAKIGWFVSDRNQPSDKVCIYRFIPNETKEIYELRADNEKQIRSVAMLSSISNTQFDMKAVEEAKRRISELSKIYDGSKDLQSFLFVLDNQHVLTDIAQLKKSESQVLAKAYIEKRHQIKEIECQLDALRKEYAQGNKSNLSNTILECEKKMSEGYSELFSLQKKIRHLELAQ